MDAGRLRHRVTIQSVTETRDTSSGAISTSWADVATVWAAVEPLSGREFLAAQAGQSEVVARILIRYMAGVTAKMRVVHGARIYNIHAVLADKESGAEHLTLMVSEGVNNG
jgi:SPP1 family predicted phage head-tail adaptor